MKTTTDDAVRELRFLATGDKGEVSALFARPGNARALLVLGHGAGGNMRSRLVYGLSRHRADFGVATFRYQFPYTEKGGRRPDSRAVLLATVRSAVTAAVDAAPDLPLFAGGHSMSGRMTSMAAAEEPSPGLRGIVFVAFPISGKAAERTLHLADVTVPMLFLQGTRDTLTPLDDLRPVCERLGDRATLHVVDTADHGFKVLKRSGQTDESVQAELAQTITAWMSGVE